MPYQSDLPELRYYKGDLDELMHRISYWDEKTGRLIIVDEGYLTNHASIPKIVPPFIINDRGRITPAAVIHDYLYDIGQLGFTPECEAWMSRSDADRIFLDIMLEMGMPKWRAYLAYSAVRLNLLAQARWAEEHNHEDF